MANDLHQSVPVASLPTPIPRLGPRTGFVPCGKVPSCGEALQILTTTTTVPSYQAGVDAVRSRRADALFGERAILLDAARNRDGARDLIVLDSQFTRETDTSSTS